MTEVLLIIGTVGAGKTTTAEAVGELLIEQGVPHAVIDLDAIRNAWPAPGDDPFNFALTLTNLHSLVRNYREAGMKRIVLAGVIESADERKKLAEAVGGELTVCRLRLDLQTIRQRLAVRHAGADQALQWHLERSGELHEILEEAATEDVVVDGSQEGALDLAAKVMKAVGWTA
jgi:adenylylsulfate kinase